MPRIKKTASENETTAAEQLTAQAAEMSASPAAQEPPADTAKKAKPAAKTGAKKTAAKTTTAKKTPAKKAPAKKTAAKKTTAKKTTTASTVKKAAASTAKKTTTAKKATAKSAEKIAAPGQSAAPASKAPAAAAEKETAVIRPNANAAAKMPQRPKGEPIFALDIGTRSIIGIVAEKSENDQMRILTTVHREHKTRAMLDGQIHDVPQVADLIHEVKKELEASVGSLKAASVAAAGRALYTMTADATTEINGVISDEQQRALDFAGVQAAQAKIATSKDIEDPGRYYCVGYSTIQYTLDDIPLKSLVGQRGKLAKATVIATFLPRQVIDSMQSALRDVGLEMRALTLEPIAAINVLIPPTMRHLNLVLVDIGAGTSDVAITKNGSIIAYGMVPLAGDEITEAISQRYLLDFNVAENVKRNASAGRKSKFTDILGTEYDLGPSDVIGPIMPNIQNLADSIARQVLELNGDSPQAVMLVGGGAQTPGLPALVAKALSVPENRVAVRHPENIIGVESIPAELQRPDAVTPLGILKIASINLLHFLSVYVNEQEINLFNFRDLTVSDALLNAGIQLKKFNGRPGLGLMVTVNGEKKFFPGSLPSMAILKLDGEDTTLDTLVKAGCHITVAHGKDGETPEVRLSEVLKVEPDFPLIINGRETRIQQAALVNGEPSKPERLLADNDIVESKEPRTLGEALKAAGYPPTGRKIHYTLNDNNAQYVISPEIYLNDEPATISMPIHEGDRIEYQMTAEPKLSDVLDISRLQAAITITYNDQEYEIPSAALELEVNGHKASPGTYLEDGSVVYYRLSEKKATTVNEALLAVGFEPPPPTSRVSVSILVNRRPVIFTDPIKNGDRLDIIIKPLPAPPAAAPAGNAGTAAGGTTGLGSGTPSADISGSPAPASGSAPAAGTPARSTGFSGIPPAAGTSGFSSIPKGNEPGVSPSGFSLRDAIKSSGGLPPHS